MKNEKLFEKDFKLMIEVFPQLNHFAINQANTAWLITGQLDIFDSVGTYWDTFSIKIYVPYEYPYCVPIVLETENKIERGEHRHINKIGMCCLDIEHRLLVLKKRGINLTSFIKEKVYPYFANQIYYEEEKKYANGEYDHYFDGTQQFYKEDLNIPSIKQAIEIIKFTLSKQKLQRNDLCFCGGEKYKDCHLSAVEFLNSVGSDQLEQDLSDFEKLLVQS